MMLTSIFEKTDADKNLTLSEIEHLLQLAPPDLSLLYQKADQVRHAFMGDRVYLRGIIEFSNYCKKNCFYCGIRAGNTLVQRYRMGLDEILDVCKKMEKKFQTTVVLQSGEDVGFTKEILGELIARIKKETSLAVTLSVGERPADTYLYWKQKGMDRYLLRFETSDPQLFKEVHPDDDFEERLSCIYELQKIGVQTGSGFLIGLPNETLLQLAGDILFCTQLKLDMIGVGPFIANPNTPLGHTQNPFETEIFFKTMAILRLLNPKAHIPATTAFDAIAPDGRNRLLKAGANVFMPNASPRAYRKHYLLYPGKPCVDESDEDCAGCVLKRITSLGRTY